MISMLNFNSFSTTRSTLDLKSKNFVEEGSPRPKNLILNWFWELKLSPREPL